MHGSDAWPAPTATRRCPLNLVKAGFGQLAKLGPKAQGGAVAGVSVKNPSANLATCNNPTFVKGDLSANHLAQIAPMPLACQKATSAPCGAATVAPGTNGSNTGGGGNPSAGHHGHDEGARPGTTGTTAGDGHDGTGRQAHR